MGEVEKYASDYLEDRGLIYGHDFVPANSVDVASKVFIERLELDEDWKKIRNSFGNNHL